MAKPTEVGEVSTTNKNQKIMFTLPTNATPQVRPEVVNHIVRAMFKNKHLDYCDYRVFTDDIGGFRSYWDSPSDRPSVIFTEDERRAAFEEFRAKGYHIFKQVWYSNVNGHYLWSFGLRERKECGYTDITWLF